MDEVNSLGASADIVWHKPAMASDGMVARRFVLNRGGAQVPGMLWMPEESPAASVPLVLACHGGSGHKQSAVVLDMVQALQERGSFAVCAIDGPVHGDRREVFDEGPTVRDEFRALWAAGGSIAGMVSDWQEALDAMLALPTIDKKAVGWYGLSMGAAYGIPLLAADPRIRVAVTGMWGSCRPGSEPLVLDAPRIQGQVLVQMKWDDPLFTREGQLHLFDRVGTQNKQLNVYPGGHTDPKGPQLEDAVAFLARHLAPASNG